MGKFSDYVGTIENQTESLREVVSAKSGVDCSKMSIGECAGVMDSLEVTSQEEARYIRPSWYPDIEDIVMKAPDITVGGTEYAPLYIMLLNNNEVSSPFYTNTSTFTSYINYYRGTDCDAYIFSDIVNNDISNANENTLQIGKEIIHTWDENKDIYDKDKTQGVRWAVAYKIKTNKDTYAGLTVYCSDNAGLIEVVVRQGTYKTLFENTTGFGMKYFKMCKDVKKAGASSKMAVIKHCRGIEEFVNESNSVISFDSSFLNYVPNLKKLTTTNCRVETTSFLNHSKLKNVSFDNTIYLTNSLSSLTSNAESVTINISDINFSFYGFLHAKKVNLLNVENISSSNFLSDSVPLEYIKIPNTLKTWSNTSQTATLCYVRYVELFNDFNISGVNLTGYGLKTKQWLKDLCGWLKDRTDDTANTMIIGTHNLRNADQVYLTFNPNDKRDITFDGVTAETEGAMSITEFITTQLNWTLS